MNKNLHYQANFSLRLEDNPQKSWESAVKAIRSWVRERVRGPEELEESWFFRYGRWTKDREPYVFVETARTIGAGTDSVPEFWAVRMQIRDPSNSFRFWTTDIGIKTMAGEDLEVAVTVSNYVRPGYFGEEPTPQFSSPKIVHKLLHPAFGPHSGDLPLQLSAVYYRAADVPHLRKLMASPSRRCPIVILSRHRTHGEPLIDPRGLTTKAAGTAAFYVSADGYAESELIDALPDRFRVMGGMIRIFMPGVRFDSEQDAGRHRYYSTSQIENLGEATVATEIIRSLTRRMDWSDHRLVFSVEEVKDRYRKQRLNELKAAPSNDSVDELLELLTADNDSLTGRVQELETDLEEMGTSVEHLRFELDHFKDRAINAESDLGKLKSATDLDTMLQEIPEDVDGCLRLTASIYSDRIEIADSAFKTASDARINKLSGQLPTIWKLLRSIPTALYNLYFELNLDGTRLEERYQEQTGFELALTEGSMTRNDKTLMSLRNIPYEGQDYFMEPHVKFGTKAPRLLRVHFAFDNDKRRIVIGHCGDHLDTYSTRKLS